MSTRIYCLAFSVLATTACSLSSEDPSGKESGGLSGAPGSKTPDPSAAPGAPSASSNAAPGSAAVDEGLAFTISNAVAGNEVLVIHRDKDGALANMGKLATGGTGTGKGLGSQRAVVLSDDRRFLLAVDPGSNEITSFAVKGSQLTVLSHVPSGGMMPISIALHGDLVYALNAGDSSCIVGFRMDASGKLTEVPGSSRYLSGAAVGPAQVSFSPQGDVLVVTEKATNKLDTFVVRDDGTPSDGAAQTSVGMTPFGFAFTPHGNIVVSEAFGGTAGAGALSSYQVGASRIDATGGAERDIASVSASVPDHQSAPCWVAVTGNGAWAFTSNTASGNVSTYAVGTDGAIALVGDGNAGATGAGSKPIDIALDRSDKHLMVLNSGTHSVVGFTVGADGSLTPTASAAWIPESAVGLAGY